MKAEEGRSRKGGEAKGHDSRGQPQLPEAGGADAVVTEAEVGQRGSVRDMEMGWAQTPGVVCLRRKLAWKEGVVTSKMKFSFYGHDGSFLRPVGGEGGAALS